MTPALLLLSSASASPGSESNSPTSCASGASGLVATNAEKHSLPFGAFASPVLVVLEKWLLVWQVVTAAEQGIWGWDCGGLVVLAGCLHEHHLPTIQEGHGASHHGGACCQKYFIYPLKKVTCLPTTGNGPRHSCSLAGHGPVGMPCASPKHHAWSV